MSFQDAHATHRTEQGFLYPTYFDAFPHASLVHEQSQRTWPSYTPAARASSIHVMDHWILHPGLAITLQVLHPPEGPPQGQCMRLTSSMPDISLELPLYTLNYFNNAESSRAWWQHPLQRGWSPLKWWIANRTDEAAVLAHLCGLHLTPWDWHRAGSSSAPPTNRIRIAHSPLHRLLSLASSRPLLCAPPMGTLAAHDQHA